MEVVDSAADPSPHDRPSGPDHDDAATAVAPTVPSTLPRVVAFFAILVAGAAGGFIGYAVTDLQCSGECATPNGIGGLVGAVIAATGVAVVVQLALRAMSEWRTIQARGGAEAERQRQTARQRRVPPESRPRPRVR